MATKKASGKTQGKSKPKAKTKKAAAKSKTTGAAKQSKVRRSASAKAPGLKKKAAKKKRSSRPALKEPRSPEPSTLRGAVFAAAKRSSRRGTRSESAGQSGDVQALSRKAIVDSESVEELLEEGQALEAAAVSGVEDALDPDEAEVYTHEVPEDDVPEEYTDED